MKKIAIVKFNTSSWFDYREELIKRFKADSTLVSYSDTEVKTTDTLYELKLIPVNVNFLDPLLGYEGSADASDLLKFLDVAREKLIKNYILVPKEEMDNISITMTDSKELSPKSRAGISVVKKAKTDEI